MASMMEMQDNTKAETEKVRRGMLSEIHSNKLPGTGVVVLVVVVGVVVGVVTVVVVGSCNG